MLLCRSIFSMKSLKIIPIILQAAIYVTTLVIFKACFHFKVKGRENVLDLPAGIIFAANHLSEWDGILVRVALPFFSAKFSPMYYVSRTRKFYNYSGWRRLAYGGLIFRMLAAYPAYAGEKNYEISLRNFLEILKLRRNVCIFPEGRRSPDGRIGPAHGGAAFLSWATGTPVVPVAIKGTWRLTLREAILRKRKVEIVFGKPIRPAEIVTAATPTVADFQSGAAFVLRKVAELF